MAQTIVEKILSAHAGAEAKAGEIVDIFLDTRAARDFGGANVVKNLVDHCLEVADPSRTAFTFDCNPAGSDQLYAANQQKCRLFARERGIKVYDIDQGIGTHVAIEKGLAWPGSTFVSTDSHANILGAIGAFGQGLGDVDMAAAWAYGKVWFKVPETVRIELRGIPSEAASPKDVALRLLRQFGANGLLGRAAEIYGEYAETLGLSGRITISSLATEMGAIIIFFPPSDEVVTHCRKTADRNDWKPVFAGEGARYARTETIDIEGLGPMISRPGHPEDAVEIEAVRGKKIDSVFIGSCTNGRYEDLEEAARIFKGRKVAPGVVAKIVPATDAIWQKALGQGLMEIFKKAGALVSNAGCAGCAAGQVGQNGPGEVTVSTGNRNFAGKQGKGEVYLASPAVAAASAVAGFITTPDSIPESPALFDAAPASRDTTSARAASPNKEKPLILTGRVWVVKKDNIDTDMIFHNRHLAITKLEEMGPYAFGNLAGWEDFPKKAKPGDIIVTGANFGAGSSRQQAVDCFKAIGIAAIIAKSFGAIYERNAINAGLAIVTSGLVDREVKDGDEVTVDLVSGEIGIAGGAIVKASPWPKAQTEIYLRGGLLG